MFLTGKMKIAVLVFAVCAASIYVFFTYRDFIYLWNGARGIDLSHHQGEIDWSKLSSSDISFAYIKATEGGNFVDPYFKKNWQAAKEAGLIVGAYHFFRICKPGAIQADNFLATVPSDPGQLPPVIDVEHEGPCNTVDIPADIEQQIITMAHHLEAKAGCKPIIYASSTYEANLISAMDHDQTYWVPSLSWPPSFQNRNWIFWQYTATGRLKGINADIDLNVFRGSRQDLATYLEGHPCFKGA